MLKESREIKKMLTLNTQIEDWDQILKNVFQCYFKSTQFLRKLTKRNNIHYPWGLLSNHTT